MARAVTDTSSVLVTEGAGSAIDQTQSKANHGFTLELQLWVVVLALMSFGFVMIYSASSAMALKKFSDADYYLKRQALFAGLGIAMLSIARRIPYRVYRQLVYPILFSAVIGLILVLVPGLGVELNHARRWLNLGLFLVQPAEFAKVAWLVYLSVSLTKKQEKIKRFSIGFLPHIFILRHPESTAPDGTGFRELCGDGGTDGSAAGNRRCAVAPLAVAHPVCRGGALQIRLSGPVSLGTYHGFPQSLG